MRTIYQTDGSLSAFFTTVFDGYKDETAFLSSEKIMQTGIGDRLILVTADEEKSKRVQNKIRAIDSHALLEIDYILRTPFSDKEQVAFSYIKLLVKNGAPVREYLSLPEIRKAVDYFGKTAHERHILSGFLRFHETQNGVYYSAFEPDNDITALLMPHFFARFKNTPFIIHDVKRELAGISDGRRWTTMQAGGATVAFSQSEDGFLSLWEHYYQTVAIKERKNTKQMKNYMPVRYWKYMPEKQAEEQARLSPFKDN